MQVHTVERCDRVHARPRPDADSGCDLDKQHAVARSLTDVEFTTARAEAIMNALNLVVEHRSGAVRQVARFRSTTGAATGHEYERAVGRFSPTTTGGRGPASARQRES